LSKRFFDIFKTQSRRGRPRKRPLHVGLLKKLVIRVAQPLPTNVFVKLTPLRKVEKIFGISFQRDIRERSIHQLPEQVSEMVEKTINPIMDWFSLTSGFVAQHPGKLTAYNEWVVFLCGQGSSHRGRERSHRRIFSAFLRGSGFGTPLQGFYTVCFVAAMWMLKMAWDYSRRDGGDEESDTTPPPLPPPTGGDETVVERPQRRGLPRLGLRLMDPPDPPLTLRELVIEALIGMGMSRQGANDLVDGRTIYGVDAQVYRRICSLIFIRCTECEEMIAIDHADLFDYVLLVDEVLVVYCPNCGTWTVADVTTIRTTQVFHLHDFV
jgi:hypothetical protein